MRWRGLWCLGAAGCALGPYDGDVYWVEIEDGGGLACTTTVTENYTNAEFVEPDGPPDDRVTDSANLVFSPEGGYAYVQRGEGGLVLVNWQGQVFTGSVEDGVLTADWARSVQDDRVSEFPEAYRFESRNRDEQTSTIQLGRVEDVEGLGGTFGLEVQTLTTYLEQDRWNAEQVGVFGSRIPSGTLLQPVEGSSGSVFNVSDADDCADTNCRLEIDTDCDVLSSLQAWRVGGGAELFETLEDYAQPSDRMIFVP